MKKILLVLVFSLLSLVSIFAENVELKIHLLNGTTAVRFNMTNPPKKVVKYQEAAVNSLDSKFL